MRIVNCTFVCTCKVVENALLFVYKVALPCSVGRLLMVHQQARPEAPLECRSRLRLVQIFTQKAWRAALTAASERSQAVPLALIRPGRARRVVWVAPAARVPCRLISSSLLSSPDRTMLHREHLHDSGLDILSSTV